MTVNGKEVALQAEMSLAVFLESRGYHLPSLARIAVEKNGVIIPKESYTSEMLADGDTLEIVGYVGGG